MRPLAVIVGGHGESESVPILIRRIARLLDGSLNPIIDPVLRVPESRLVKAGELERTVDLAARNNGGEGGILILVDCDDGCPAQEGPALLNRASAARGDVSVAVVLAKREFESWFLAAAESLRGRRNLSDNLAGPADPEAVRGAKEWLTDRMVGGSAYSPTTDQPALTSLFDIEAARQRADSFDKCYREIARLLRDIQ